MDQILQLGDIVIFKAEEDLLSKCIAWLTNSDVSHAAMIYGNDAIVEVGSNGVGVHKVAISGGNEAYLMRLSSAPDPVPLRNAADAYLNAGTKYDFGGLIFLGGLLILRKIYPNKMLLKITRKIIQAGCLLLDKLIQKHVLKNPNGAVVCSQLIYQIYYDCGAGYRIEIKHGDFENGCAIRLIDLVNEEFFSEGKLPTSPEDDFICQDGAPTSQDGPLIDQNGLSISQEDLVSQLYEALEESTSLDSNAISFDSLKDIKPLVQHFLSRLQSLLDLLGSDMPIDALFVTPGDLVYHAENLEKVCTIGIERVHESPSNDNDQVHGIPCL